VPQSATDLIVAGRAGQWSMRIWCTGSARWTSPRAVP